VSGLLVEYPASGVRILRIHRPQRRNALDAALIAAVRDALAAANADADCRILMLAGSGNVFCSGADLAEMAGGAAPTAALSSMLLELHRHRCPSIALVQGAAVGGGVGLVAACDLAVATADARFRLPEVRLGLLPAVISPYLVRALGERCALRHALDGEWFGAQQALAEGLLHEVVEVENLLPRSLRWAATIAQGAPGALQRCKDVFALSGARPPDAALAALLADEFASVISGPEARERIAAQFDPVQP
jgi:methylglutaconyl-CoA hydratase